MNAFHFSISGVSDENKNGKPDVRIRFSVLGIVIIDDSIDLDVEKAVGLIKGLLDSAGVKLGLVKQ